MNKKGFTLAELLATIIVLGIISGIIYVSVTNIHKTTKTRLIETSAMNLFTAADNYYANIDYKNFPEGGIAITALDLQSTAFTSGKIKLDETGEFILVNVTDGEYCVNGAKDNLSITLEDCTITSPVEGATRAYVMFMDDTLPSEYDVEGYFNMQVIYTDENNIIITVAYAMGATITDESVVESAKEAMAEFYSDDYGDEADNILHYYINIDENFSYVAEDFCYFEPKIDVCSGTFNFLDQFEEDGTTPEEEGFIVIEF